MKATRDVLNCETCGTTFDRIGSRGPLPRFCPECRAERQRLALRVSAARRRQRDPEGERAKARAYRAANPEKLRQLERASHERDREKRNARSRQWGAANAEKARADAKARAARAMERDPAAYRAKKAERAQRRRARLRAVKVEIFAHAEVFERDGWVCQLCGEPVDRSAIFPDCRAPSLDHIVPLSLGGEHSRANTQCAHLGCNIRKGNRHAR